MKTKTALSLIAAALGFCTLTVSAQNYPSRPVRFVVPFVAGGPTDIQGRMLGEKLAQRLGQQVLVDNRGGANGILAVDNVAKSPPDGYTLLSYSGSMWTLPFMQSVPYDPVHDFAPISLAVTSPNILVIHPDVPAKNVKELIAFAKANPGKLNYSSVASGSSGHLTSELFKSMAGVDIVRVLYKGGGPAMTDLLGGNIDAVVASAPTAVPLVQSGKLTALAVTGAVRGKALPDVATVQEQGFPGFDAVNWYAFVAPPGTPRPIVDKLNAAIIGALKDPGTIEKLANVGMETDPSTPEQMAAYVKKQYDLWGEVVKTIKF